jgi:hypothetical protein
VVCFDVPIKDLLVGVGGNVEEPRIPCCHDLSCSNKQDTAEHDEDDGVDDEVLVDKRSIFIMALGDFGEDWREN